jgi:hypothetical protein
MPRATVISEAETYDLKTLPGGYVKLRPLNYGELLKRRDGASRMSMMQEQRRGRRQQGDQKIDFELMQEWSRHYEFSRCIVEHNLEDETGAKLDFSNKLAITKLDPKIGSEIERLIDELNQEEEEGEGLDEEGFTRLSGESLEEPSLSTSPEEDTLIVQ